jgi:hypothetical protein
MIVESCGDLRYWRKSLSQMEEYCALVRDFIACLKEDFLPGDRLFCDQKQKELFRVRKHIAKSMLALPPQKIIPEKKEAAPKNQHFIEKEVEKSPVALDHFGEIKKTLLKRFPHFELSETLPDDAIAVKLAMRYRLLKEITPVILIRFSKETETQKLYLSLASAISKQLMPAKVFFADEISELWDHFFANKNIKLIISERNVKANAKCLTLQPASAYLDPEQKRLLWKEICQSLR